VADADAVIEVDEIVVDARPRTALRNFARNVSILLIVALVSSALGFAGGASYVVSRVLSDGPLLGQRMMDLGVRLQAFDPASDVFQWHVQGQGLFAGNWEELEKRLEASSDKNKKKKK